MAKKGSFSKVYDKNGDYADVEAVRFDGTRTVQMQGDVTASQTWNGDPSSPLTLNASIGAKKVTQDKIGDKAVGSGQMADGSVGITQMDPNAMTSSATSGDTRLITAGGVRTEIDNAILNRGKDYGPMTPTQINAISETIPTGSTVHVTAAGTITDGDIEVRQGEDLKYYRSGNTHYWYSMDGDFKLKQQAKTSPTASGNALSFIDSITQDENGEISATKKTVQDGTTSQKGVVQLEDSHSSTSTTKAATPNSVKSAYDLANTANTGAVKNVAYDSINKKITKTINGQTTDVVSVATLKTDMALNNVDNTSDANKPVSTAQQDALDLKLDKTGDGKDVTASFTEASTRENIGTGEKLSVMFGKIKKWFTDLKALAFKDTVSDSDISGTISDSHIASASTWNGKVDKVSGATNGNLAALDSNGNLTDSGKKASDFELVTNKVNAWQGTLDNTHYPSEKLVKDSLDAKFGFARISSQSSIDLNNFNTTSFYELNAPSFDNSPVTSNQLTLLVADSRGRKFQMLMSGDESGGTNNVCLFIRKKDISSWGSWVELANTSAVNAKVTGPSSATADDIAVFDGTTGKLIKGSGVAVLPSTSTWDGTSDAKVPTAKAVQTKLDAISTAAGAEAEVTAAALDDLDARMQSVEDAVNSDNIGDKIADSFDAQVLKVGGQDVVANIEYVAAQSGGGGDLMKTVAGTQTSVLRFMNDSEAVAIWDDAKQAAANAS